MDASELRALQAPIKSRYQEDPSAAVVTLRARGVLGDSVSLHGRHRAGSSRGRAAPGHRGDGSFACSGDMLLEALVACGGVTLNAVATALGIAAIVTAEGDLDFRGTLGVANDAAVGFRASRLAFDLDTDATTERMDKLVRLTERYCVVYQSLRQPLEIMTSLA